MRGQRNHNIFTFTVLAGPVWQADTHVLSASRTACSTVLARLAIARIGTNRWNKTTISSLHHHSLCANKPSEGIMSELNFHGIAKSNESIENANDATTTIDTYESRNWRQSSPLDTRTRSHHCRRSCRCHHSDKDCYHKEVLEGAVLQPKLKFVITPYITGYQVTGQKSHWTSIWERNNTSLQLQLGNKITTTLSIWQSLLYGPDMKWNRVNESLALRNTSQSAFTHGLHSYRLSILEDTRTCNHPRHSHKYRRFRTGCFHMDLEAVLQRNE